MINLITERQKWELVNKSETFEELAIAIVTISDRDGTIKSKGRHVHFSVESLLESLSAVENGGSPNLLTRTYGIRQQAMYILYYQNLIKEHERIFRATS